MALLDRVAGKRFFELDADSKCSNGVNAVSVRALQRCAGRDHHCINPKSGGHAYNQ